MSLSTLDHRFMPAASAGTPPAAGKLVLVLHGRGDSMDGFTWLPGALALPGHSYLFLNGPDDYFGGCSWYDFPPQQGPDMVRSRGLLTAVLDELLARGWRAQNLIVFGFSQGAVMAIDVGQRYPHGLGAVCAVSGYLYLEDSPAEVVTAGAMATPWWLSAGTLDPAIAPDRSAAAATALEAAGITVTWRTYVRPHTIDPARELPELRTWLAGLPS